MSLPSKDSPNSQLQTPIQLGQKYAITQDQINEFIASNFRGRNGIIKSVLRDMKTQEMESWAYIIWSSDFRKKFRTKEQIFKEKSERDILIFEELMIMIPLNYIYWRNGILYEDIFPATSQIGKTCWAHAVASCIVLAYRRIIGRSVLDFEEVKNYLIDKYDPKREGQHTAKILPEIVKHYGLRCEEVKYDNLNLFNPNGSYRFYICTFYFDGQQWNNFSSFFDEEKNKNVPITSKDLNKIGYNKKFGNESGGHAVVLIDEDDYSLTFLNSWGKNWGNEGKFSVARSTVSSMNFKFYSVYWYASDLDVSEQFCYENRRKKAVDAFYEILNYTNLLSPIDSTDSSPLDNKKKLINLVKKNQNDEAENDIKFILKDFCQDFWKSESNQESNFRAEKLPSAITICKYNSLELNEQLYISEKIIIIKSAFKQKTDFFTKIFKVLNFFKEKNYITNACIEILNEKNIKLIDVNDELEVQFSPFAIESFYQSSVLDLNELINHISQFSHFYFDLMYPHQLFQTTFDKLINIMYKLNINFKIRLFIKEIENKFENTNLNKMCSSIRLDKFITSIDNKIFSECPLLTHITIPSSVTSIGNYCFLNCSSLAQITIPFLMTEIREGVFGGCSSLTQITLPSSVTSIGKYAFCRCSSLAQITLPSSVTSIEEYAFCRCSSLAQITLPSSVTSIGKYAFCRCSSLAQITIPSTVTSIEEYTFKECTLLNKILIPSSVSKIGWYAFFGCSSLTQITIPSSVTEIGNNAFEGCSSLTQISIPSSITLIGSYVFNGCKSLKNIDLPKNLSGIDKKAFYNCSLSKVLIPSNTKMNSKCFDEGVIINFYNSSPVPNDESNVYTNMQYEEEEHCTINETGKRYVKQNYFRCLTCNHSVHEGCCEICAKTYHLGHNLYYCGTIPSFCGSESKDTSKSDTGYVGLNNQGATGYLNSFIQALFHLPAFRKLIYDMPTTGNENPKTSISLAFQQLFYELQFSDKSCSTKKLTKSFGWDSLISEIPQDFEEFSFILINYLELKTKGTILQDSIPHLIRGRFRKHIKCKNVNYESFKEEFFNDLSMDIKGIPNLSESFKSYVKHEELTGDNKYITDEFGEQEAIIVNEFFEFPPVLNIHLKRFTFDTTGTIKINDHFEFPEMIDLTEYLADESSQKNSVNIYDLYGVIVHSGSASNGHYYAFLRTPTDPQWYKFDDSKVSKETVENAINANFGDENHNYSGYILIYVRRENAKSLFENINDDSIPEHLKTYFKVKYFQK